MSVRIHPRHIEAFDARGTLQATHRIPDRKGGLVLEETHYDALRKPGHQAPTALASGFLALFPDALDFLDGLKERMKTLHPIHLQKLSKLVRTFGLEHVQEALAEATKHRNFNANAVERILVRKYPLLAVEPAYEDCVISPNLDGLVDIEEASLDEYDSDIRDHQSDPQFDQPPSDPQEPQTHEDDQDA